METLNMFSMYAPDCTKLIQVIQYGVECLANLEKLPVKNFSVTTLPLKIAGGSGGPCRVVATVNQFWTHYEDLVVTTLYFLWLVNLKFVLCTQAGSLYQSKVKIYVIL